jgi:mannose-6-phosphate isomerase class I
MLMMDSGLYSFFMNLIELTPGEAMYVQEDGLHAWLDGQIIELMANSYASPFSILLLRTTDPLLCAV